MHRSKKAHAKLKALLVPKSPTRQVTGPYFTKMKPELSTCITAYKVTVLVCREHTPVTEEHIGNVCSHQDGGWRAHKVSDYELCLCVTKTRAEAASELLNAYLFDNRLKV